MNDEGKNRHRRRWWQFGLRSLLLLVLLVAIGMLVVRVYFQPYWRQKQTVALIERLGGTCQTAEVGQWWLKLLGNTHNVTQVNLADCDDPDAYVADIAELPAIELLIVGGPAFTDEHARRLHQLHTLCGLILDCTNVSEEALASLRGSLSETEVYTSQRGAIGALRKVGVFPRQEITSPSGVLPAPSLSLRKLAGDEWFGEETMFRCRARFDDIDAAHLAVLRNLRWLSLSGSQVTDAGVARLKGLRQLEMLFLSDTVVTDAVLESLREMSRLQILDLSESRVTPAGVTRLRTVLSRCRIYGPEE